MWQVRAARLAQLFLAFGAGAWRSLRAGRPRPSPHPGPAGPGRHLCPHLGPRHSAPLQGPLLPKETLEIFPSRTAACRQQEARSLRRRPATSEAGVAPETPSSPRTCYFSQVYSKRVRGVPVLWPEED